MTLTRALLVAAIACGAASNAAAQTAAPYVAVRAVDASSAWLARYERDKDGPEQVEQWSKTFKVGPNGSLDLSNVSGDIEITGGPGDEIRIEATKRVRARNPETAKQQLAMLEIRVVETNGRVEVRTEFPRGQHFSGGVDFEVRVPAGAGVSAHNVSGDITLQNVKGEVRLDTVSGGVTAQGAPQVLRANAVSGDVSLTDVGSPDVLAAKSISGDVTTRGVKAKSIDFQTISGTISLVDAACDRAQVRSVSGDVEFSGPLARSGRYEFNSHSGDVRVGVTGGAGFELTASSFSGDIRSEIQLTRATGLDDRDDDRPGPRTREVHGTYGDGSALLLVKTFSGDVVLMKGRK